MATQPSSPASRRGAPPRPLAGETASARLRKEAAKTRYRAIPFALTRTKAGEARVAISSEAPVDMGWYKEILRHDPGCIDLTRASQGLSMLADHDRSRLIGRVNSIGVDADKILRGVPVRGTTAAAKETWGDIDAGIRPGGSVGYEILQWREEKREDGLYLIADLWAPLEYSSVTIEADLSSGVGRAAPTRDGLEDGEDEDEDLPAEPAGGGSGDGEEDDEDRDDDDGDDRDEGEEDDEEDDPSEANAPGEDEADRDDDEGENAAKPPKTNKKTKKLNGTPAVPGRKKEAIMADPNTPSAGAGNDPNAAAVHRDHSLALMKLARTHNLPAEKVEIWLREGITLERAKDQVLTELGQRDGKPLAQPGAEELDLNTRDAGKYSYVRALAQAAKVQRGERATGFEAEISQDLEKRMPANYQRRGGMLVPLRLRKEGTRATPLNALNATQGAELVYAQYGGEVIELLRNMAASLKLGARLLSGLGGPVSFPKQTGAATAYWVGENPASLTESEAAFGHALLSPKTLQAKSYISRQLLVETTPDVEMMVREDLAKVHALAWDKAAFHGASANNEPTGIYNATGVNAQDFGSANITFANAVAATIKVANANALLGQLGFVTTPKVAGDAISTLRFAVNGAYPIWDGPLPEGTLADYRGIATNQISNTLGSGNKQGLIFGNWNDLLIGQFGGAVEIIVDPYTAADSGLIKYVSFQMVDILIRHAQSFTIANNLT